MLKLHLRFIAPRLTGHTPLQGEECLDRGGNVVGFQAKALHVQVHPRFRSVVGVAGVPGGVPKHVPGQSLDRRVVERRCWVRFQERRELQGKFQDRIGLINREFGQSFERMKNTGRCFNRFPGGAPEAVFAQRWALAAMCFPLARIGFHHRLEIQAELRPDVAGRFNDTLLIRA